MIYFLPIISSVSVYIALFLESFLPYPYLVEEFIKAILIFPLTRKRGKYIYLAILIGFFFGLSEAFLYSFNLFLVSSFEFLILRIFSSMFLHTITSIVFYYISRLHKYSFVLALITTIVIHFGYNYYLR